MLVFEWQRNQKKTKQLAGLAQESQICVGQVYLFCHTYEHQFVAPPNGHNSSWAKHLEFEKEKATNRNKQTVLMQKSTHCVDTKESFTLGVGSRAQQVFSHFSGVVLVLLAQKQDETPNPIVFRSSRAQPHTSSSAVDFSTSKMGRTDAAVGDENEAVLFATPKLRNRRHGKLGVRSKGTIRRGTFARNEKRPSHCIWVRDKPIPASSNAAVPRRHLVRQVPRAASRISGMVRNGFGCQSLQFPQQALTNSAVTHNRLQELFTLLIRPSVGRLSVT
jgi:hypothetical protein